MEQANVTVVDPVVIVSMSVSIVLEDWFSSDISESARARSECLVWTLHVGTKFSGRVMVTMATMLYFVDVMCSIVVSVRALAITVEDGSAEFCNGF